MRSPHWGKGVISLTDRRKKTCVHLRRKKTRVHLRREKNSCASQAENKTRVHHAHAMTRPDYHGPSVLSRIITGRPLPDYQIFIGLSIFLARQKYYLG